MELQTIIFLGKSGSGKGTQIAKLIEYIGTKDTKPILNLGAGARFRDFISQDFYASKLSREINEKGGLQPSFLAIWAWGGELIRKLKADEHLLLDGAPRRIQEVDIMESAFDFYKRQNIKVVYVDVSNEWATEKLQGRGREDDKELEDIQERLDWFNTEVIPVIESFKNNPKYTFLKINGEQDIDIVHQEIISKLEI